MQATNEPLRRNFSEYAPRELCTDAKAAILASLDFAGFLERVRPRCDATQFAHNCMVCVNHAALAVVISLFERLADGRLCWRKMRR